MVVTGKRERGTDAARLARERRAGAKAARAPWAGICHFRATSLAAGRKLGFVESGASARRCLAHNAEVRHIDTELTRATRAERRR